LISFGVGVLAVGLLADSRIVELLGAVYSVAAAYRLAIRLFSPSGWFRTEMEFLAAASLRSLTRVAVYSLLIWMVVTQRWTGAVILGSCLVAIVTVETLIFFAVGRFFLRRKQVAKS
jgi:hypothetical protein